MIVLIDPGVYISRDAGVVAPVAAMQKIDPITFHTATFTPSSHAAKRFSLFMLSLSKHGPDSQLDQTRSPSTGSG
jgi:hypothetical protein